MKVSTRWQILNKHVVNRIDEFQDVILANRHWTSRDLTQTLDWRELTPENLKIDPTQLQLALERILQAREQKQKVLIFGDYDVDGNGASAIAWQGLQTIGIQATPFIPHRFRHGYGMSVTALEEICAASQPDLIITVDNGITARPALEFCAERGIDVIVTDHHQADQTQKKLPCLAIVQTTALAGAGVAWFLMWQLGRTVLGDPKAQKLAQSWLDLLALATIVDQVPLVGFNRQLVKAGIVQLRQSKRPGIVALCQAAGLKQASLSTHDIGFSLGPRINAIGRLTNTLEALRLLCTNKLAYAKTLAATLSNVNRSRQELTNEMFELACAQIDPEHLDKIVIVADQNFHEGIIGLIASKLVDTYHRPALAIAIGKEVAKGSARSIEGFNITDFIRQFRAKLLDAGGHAMAAGFGLRPEMLKTVMDAMRECANTQISDEQLIPTLTAETEVAPEVLFHPLVPALLEQLEPFGPGNPEIAVVVTAKVFGVRQLGSEQQHLRVDLMCPGRRFLNVLVWNYRDHDIVPPKNGAVLQILGQLQINEYNGRRSPQLLALDWHEASEAK